MSPAPVQAVRRALNALWRQTIWHRDAIPPAEWRDRHAKRFWYPFYDVLLMWGGLRAIKSGVPAFEDLLTEPVADVAGVLLFFVGLVALIGVGFPRLWILELTAKGAAILVWVVYAIALQTLAIQTGTGARDFVVIVALLAAIPAMYRVVQLGQEAGARWAERREATGRGKRS